MKAVAVYRERHRIINADYLLGSKKIRQNVKWKQTTTKKNTRYYLAVFTVQRNMLKRL